MQQAQKQTTKAFHGGQFYEVIKEDFSGIANKNKVINADVLDAWFEPSPRVVEFIQEHASYALRTSPPTHCRGLIEAIAQHRNIPSDNIIVGGGSSDLIFLLLTYLLNDQSKTMILDPMYGEYSHVLTKVINTKVSRIDLVAEQGFELDTEAIDLQIQEEQPDWILLVNPNSPSGKYCAYQNIIELVEKYPGIGFIIDETYIDYIGKRYSLETHVPHYENLCVIKSMSKVYGLSGARVGYAVLPLSLKRQVEKLVPPWAVNFIGQAAGIMALEDETYYQTQWKKTLQNKDKFYQQLQSLDALEVFESQTSFLLAKIIDTNYNAQMICDALKQKQIYIRNCDSMSPRFGNDYIRIAVKSEETNNIVFGQLKNILESQ